MFQSRLSRSSFSGKIQEIPALCVDNFENPCTDGARAYFLSHFHSDHTVGLDSLTLLNKLDEQCVFIYATKLTAAIIIHNYQHLKNYVKTLELGSNIISIPGNKTDSELILNVILIPAGHCLGSTMFLFETISLKVLYTGDFRIRPNDLSKYAAFHAKNGEVLKLDALYVDTTFLDRCENFPKRSDSVQETIDWISCYLDSNKDQFVILETSANYGYEYVFNKIYNVLGMKIYVDDKKWAFYSNIQNLVKGVTNNPNETSIFLTSIPDSRKSLLRPKRIRFSAMRWVNWNEDMSAVEENGDRVYVCFSTHCSRTELISFVDYLRPKKVVGFPSVYIVNDSPIKKDDGEKFVLSSRKSPKKLSCTLAKPHPKDMKVDAAVLREIFG